MIILDCKEKVLPTLRSYLTGPLVNPVDKVHHYEIQCLEGAVQDKPKIACMYKKKHLSIATFYELESLIDWVTSSDCRQPKKTIIKTSTKTLTTVSQITSDPCLTDWQPGCEEIVNSYPISQCALRKSQKRYCD